MANTINTGMSGVKPARSTLAPSEKAPTKEFAARKIALNDPVKARDFFALTEKYILGPTELNQYLKNQAALINIIDLRQTADYAKGHVLGAINLPQDQWQEMAGLSKSKVNIIYSYDLECSLVSKAAVEFAAKGYSVMVLTGGFSGWQENKFKIETQVHH